jgi:hypothetical protein
MGENGQSFIRVAKPCWDQTVGSVIKTSYIFFFLIAIHSDFNEDLKKVDKIFYSGSLSTGSPVGSLELTSLEGLMYSQATVTTHNIG